MYHAELKDELETRADEVDRDSHPDVVLARDRAAISGRELLEVPVTPFPNSISFFTRLTLTYL